MDECKPLELGLPHELPTNGPCLFETGAHWYEGYVGSRRQFPTY